MLIQFNFRNFKSFKNETTLDMVATSMKENMNNLIDVGTKDKYLKVATILGANASGKSNVLGALNWMTFFATQSLSFFNSDEDIYEKSVPVKKFLFDGESKFCQSEFEIFFIKDNIEYQYGFILDESKIHQEWLCYRNKSEKNFCNLFERNEDSIRCGEKFKDAEKFINSVEDRVLFLTFIGKTKVKKAKEVLEWFLKLRNINFGDTFSELIQSQRIRMKVLENEAIKENFENFLRDIDTGIKGIRVEQVNADKDEKYRIYSKHIDKNGKEYEIPFNEESSGTQKMFCLYESIMNSISNGTPLVVDEFDAKLHPLLVRYILNMYQNPDINKNNAQLIYTTHDIYNLTKEMFRRDQIWFVEKDENGVSELYSLAEIKLEDDKKVRNDATYNKDYIMGRYGAIPILKQFLIEEDI